MVGGGRDNIVKYISMILQAFFEGKLRIAGNTAMAMKLQSIVPAPGKAKL